MHLRLPIAFLACLGLALASCAKSRSPAPASAAPSASGASPAWQVQPMASLAEAVKAVSENQLRCADDASCAIAAGMFLAADSAGGILPDSAALVACSAFFVGDDLVLTNSHCLPPAIKLLPELCKERVRIILPSATNSESIPCESVLGFSERANPLSPDLALLKLARNSGRSPLRLSRAGVPANSPLTFYKISPNLKQRSGLLSKESCLSIANSYRMPLYRTEKDPTFVFGNCSAAVGNSGGPLVNADGEVVGLGQAELEISESALALWGPHLASPGPIAKLALGTSLGCLLENPPAWSWNPDCKTIEELAVAEARPRLRAFLPQLEPTAEAALAPFVSQNLLLDWRRMELSSSPLEKKEALVPACYWQNEGFSQGTVLALKFPVLLLELQFNQYLQPLAPVARIAESKTEHFRFEKNRLLPLEEGVQAIELGPCGMAELQEHH